MDIADLWMPIVLSAVIVFVASSLAWMVLPHHKKDIQALPDESALTDHLTSLNVPPGTYMWPYCEHGSDMKSEAFMARFQAGPWGNMTVLKNKPNFLRNLVLTFLLYLAVSVFVAYITGQARPPGSDYMSVFQVAGATAILGYCAGGIPHAIFFSRPIRFVGTELIDGIVYGLLTAGTFAWLWPEASGSPIPLP